MKSFLTFILLCYLPTASFASGTVIGHGGDPILDFMESTRTSMNETIKLVMNSSDIQNTFCESKALNEEQVAFCRHFFMAVAHDILVLSQGNSKTAFVLRDDPLLVQGPDGKPMMVAARTELGPNGAIEMHRDSVKELLPVQALSLITHEFQHKANYEGRFVTDNEKIGPFATGRELIGTVSAAVVTIARRHGKIGMQFGISDKFTCRVTVRGAEIFADLSSGRAFKTEDLMSYETSAGKDPMNGSVAVPEADNSKLKLRFVITEPNNCGPADPLRSNVVQIVRVKTQEDGSITQTPVTEKVFATNPICPGSNPDFEISTQNLNFACRYYATQGTSSASSTRVRRVARPASFRN